MKVTLKIFFRSKLQTILRPAPVSLPALLAELRQMTRLSCDFSLSYKDSAGRDVLVYSQESYETALRQFANSVLSLFADVKAPTAANRPQDSAMGRPAVSAGSPSERKGCLYSQTGVRYEGDLQSGLYHGRGLLMWPNGTGFVGSFSSNQRNGPGKLFLPSGDWAEGTWALDQLHGSCVYHYRDGTEYRGEYQRGKRHGPGELVGVSGAVIRQHYEDGVLKR